MHTVYVHSQTTGARLHAVTLMNADASAPNATDTSAHTNTRNSFNRLSQLESVTKDAVCHKRVPLSPNINAQRTATSVLRSCFDLLQKIQPILHSFWYQPAPNVFFFLFYRKPLFTDFFPFTAMLIFYLFPFSFFFFFLRRMNCSPLFCETLMINFPPRAVPTSTIHLLSLVINRLNSGTGCGSDDKLCWANVHFFPSFCSSFNIPPNTLATT